MSRLFFLLIIIPPLLVACGRSRTPGGPPPPPPADAAPADGGSVDAPPTADVRVPPTGGSLEFVIDLLDIGQADPTGDPNIVPGFNLDGLVSSDSDPQGCFHPDFMSPPPDSEAGVDNQLGPILSSVGMSLDFSGQIAESIANGDVLMLLRVSGVDDLRNDSSVTLEIFGGSVVGGVPALGPGGTLAPGQTFSVTTFNGEFSGQIVAGRASFSDTSISLAVPLPLNLQNGQIRFDVADVGLSRGVLGGGMDVEETVAAMVALAPDDIPESLARSILTGQADLDPDASGDCQSVSVGMVFAAVPAIIVP